MVTAVEEVVSGWYQMESSVATQKEAIVESRSWQSDRRVQKVFVAVGIV